MDLTVESTTVPEITTAYLLEHRIISYLPKYHEKIISTLPYEIKTFDDDYLLYLIARVPDENSSSLTKANEPHYYLWFERRADNWRDFMAVDSEKITSLKINSHYSAIRQGHFYQEYTIDFTLDQLYLVQDTGMDLLLINKQNVTSTINIPSFYIKAYLEMVTQNSQ
ncbi:MAG: hypothetical protein PF439_09400 [Helicobacteraceae bacterium]|nr:hypothetical protein [Helicobacteraceae bacterium]